MSPFGRFIGLAPLALWLSACKSPPSSTETVAASTAAVPAAAAASGAGTPENESLMAPADFEDQAAQEIAPQNYEQELDKLEKNIGQ